MTIRTINTYSTLLLGASFLALAACGGGSDTTEPAANAANEAASAASEATNDVAEAANDAATAAGEAANDTMAEVESAASDAMSEAENMVETAAAEAEAMANEAGEMVEAAADEVSGDYRTATPEQVAAYEALTGDAANGRRVFTKCMSCHVVQEGQNRVGPSLYGIIGREAGSIEGFRYSDANKNSGILWTEATMFAYLEQPQQYIPGTNMAFPGLPKPQDRADVIAYVIAETNK